MPNKILGRNMITQEFMQNIQNLVIERKFDEAKALLLEKQKQYSENPEILHQLGFIYMQQNQIQEALDVLKKAIKLAPDSAIIMNHLGTIYRVMEDFDEAENCYKKALELQPNYAEAHNNYGLLFYARQMYKQAEEQYTLALKAKPHFVNVLFNLALTLKAQNDIEGAIGSLLAIFEVQPEHLKAHFLMGTLLIQKKLFEDAEEHFQEVLKREPNDPTVLSGIVNAYLEADRPMEAKHYCIKLHEIMPRNVEALYNLGVIEARLNNKERAIEYYHSILQIEPKHFATLNNIAVLYLEKQNLKAAEVYFKQALELQPDNDSIKYTLNAILGGDYYKGAPKKYIENLFDQYADHFDEQLAGALDYQVPKKLKNLLERHLISRKDLTILDLGCGTGLLGEILKPWSKLLVGVDLSSKMIEKAREKARYDELYVKDDVEYLLETREIFDLITAADVFVYSGDLKLIFEACQKKLQMGGILAFTTEIEEKHDFKMQATGRFAHSKKYIKALAEQIGFKILELKQDETRSQYNKMLQGYYVILKKIV